MRGLILGALAGLLAGAAAVSAGAATTYSDRTAFMAGLDASTTLPFSNAAPFNGIDYGTSFTMDNATFSADDLVEMNPSFGGLASGVAFGADYLLWQNNGPTETVMVTFATPVNAVGFDFMEAYAQVIPFTFTGAGLTSVVQSAASPSFFGLTSATPFSSFTATIAYDPGPGQPEPFAFPAIDNFTYGTLAASGAAPEPAAWALMLTGFAAAGAMLRRHRVARA
jgi:hypothetical protein